MDRNSPANAGDVDFIPGPGRFHVPQSDEAQVPQLLQAACSRARELQLLSPSAAAAEAQVPGACALQEKPLQQRVPAPQTESSPCLMQLDKSLCGNKL